MGWSEKYKKSINCDNPKGFSQRAHCQGRKKKMNEAKEKGDHEVSMAKKQVEKSTDNLKKLAKVLSKKTDKDNLPAWVQAKITNTEHDTEAASSYMEEGKRDGKSAKDKDYSLRDWFKGGGWVQAGGKYDGKPCARQPGQKTKPFCRDADDRAAMSKDERERRAKKKRREDPNPDRKGKAKNVTEVYDTRGTKYKTPEDALKATKEFKKQGGEIVKPAPVKLANSFSNWRQELQLDESLANKLRLALAAGTAVGGALFGKKVVDDVGGALKKKKEQRDDAIKGLLNSYEPEGEMIEQRVPGTPMPSRQNQEAAAKALKDLKKQQPNPNPVRTADHYKPEGEVVSEKKDACYHKVKSRYSVWPSAYASGALVKCRKVGAKNWGNKTKKESYEYSNWRDDFQPIEIETIDLIKPEPLVVNEYKEGDKIEYSKKTQELIDRANETPIQKLGRRARQTGNSIELKAPRNPLTLPSLTTEAKKCWKGYKKVGTQKLFGKTYNRCVKEGYSNWRQELEEDWQSVNKKDKTDGMSQKAVNAYKRENPGSKLKTAVTEKNPGGKRAKRRKSFCARSNGQRKMHNIDCSKTPDKAICKARKRWRC